MVAICLLLLVGAFAKSAQIPLHTWLPDAMEGPTPVSALIHAATMVTAGVYLIARFHPLFEIGLTAADIAAFIGLATLLIAATIALVVTDLKRIIAYSTMSQIGYMFVGVGIGAYSEGLFHLMTHAFFKALLFMAAGSVIGAMANRQNIDLMGGFRKAMPFTSAMLLIGALALAAFPLTSGWFSKDEILDFAAYRGGFYVIFTIGGYIGALLTAFYAFRIGFRVVFGEPVEEARELEQGHIHHAEPENPATGEPEDTDVGFPGPSHQIAEREWPMKIAMSVLAFGALFAGLRADPGRRRRRPQVPARVLPRLEALRAGTDHYRGLPGPADRRPDLGARHRDRLLRVPAQPRLDGGPSEALPLGCTTSSSTSGTSTRRSTCSSSGPALAVGRWANAIFERYVVQGLVVAATDLVRGASAGVRGVQSGYLRSYALLLVTGFAGLGLYFLLQAHEEAA